MGGEIDSTYQPPREMAETLRPERPKNRYSIGERGMCSEAIQWSVL
jgi:hypothetical protein